VATPLTASQTRPYRPDARALILGRALHQPWNEGTRVINRNFARATALRGPARVISVTHAQFRDETRTPVPLLSIEHVYTRSGYGLVGIYLALPQLLRHLGREQASVAHLFGMPLALAPRLRQLGMRVVVHVMTSSFGARSRLLNGASWILFDRWVDAYALTSDALKGPLLKRGLHASKMTVIPPAIDTEVYRPGVKTAARQSLGLDPDEPLVVYLGRLSPNRFPAADVGKGLRAAGAHLNRSVRFVGLSPGHTYDGSENTSSYLLACSRAAAAALRQVDGAETEIRFGDLSEEEKINWLQAADVILLPFSQAESVEPPLTLLEALACGATILVSKAANHSGVVRDGVNGFVYEQADFGHRLTSVLSSLSTERDMPERARASVLTHFSYAATAEATDQLWGQLDLTRVAAEVSVAC
jgi:glycosyltransferase involved in cell wall biosynthesis